MERKGLLHKVMNRLYHGKIMPHELQEQDLDTQRKVDDSPPVTPPARDHDADAIELLDTELGPRLSQRKTNASAVESAHVPSMRASNIHPNAAVRVARSVWSFFQSLVTPPTVALLTALVIALIPALKALFVGTEGVTYHTAPDGNPPLYVIYDTIKFVGAASVPLGSFLSRPLLTLRS